MRNRITVKDLYNFKGKKKLACLLIKNIEELIDNADRLSLSKLLREAPDED